jgi:hypothetical protein
VKFEELRDLVVALSFSSTDCMKKYFEKAVINTASKMSISRNSSLKISIICGFPPQNWEKSMLFKRLLKIFFHSTAEKKYSKLRLWSLELI